MKCWFTLLFGLIVTTVSYAQHGRPGNGGHPIHPLPKVNMPVHINPVINNPRSHANSNSIYGTGNNGNNKKSPATDQNNNAGNENDKMDKGDKKKKNKKGR